MNQKNKIITSILFLLLSITSKSEIAFTQLKGIHGVVTKKLPELSPVNGFSWWKRSVVENMYRYGNDNDTTIKLIKELFYLQPDNITFGPTTLPRKPAKYLTAATIGKIIEVLQPYVLERKKEWQKEAKIKLLQTIKRDLHFEHLLQSTQKKVKNILLEAMPFMQRIAKLEEERKKILVTIKELKMKRIQIHQKMKQVKNREAQSVLKNNFNEIENNLSLHEKKQKELSSKVKGVKQNHYYKKIQRVAYNESLSEKMLQRLVDCIIGSFKESFIDHKYLPYTTQQVLLTFLWASINDKNELLDYFQNCPSALEKKEILVAGPVQAMFLSDVYTEKDYESFKKTLLSQNLTVNLLQDHYEQMLFSFYANMIWDSPIPPVFSSLESVYTYQGKEYSFPDCGETSLRNFFNIIMRVPKQTKLDIKLLLSSAQKHNLHVDKKLIDFYTKYNLVDHIETIPVHNAWNGVVSNIPGVTYITPVNGKHICEIKAGLLNMLNVIEHLLFKGSERFANAGPAEKLNSICEVLSRDNFALSWKIDTDSEDEETFLLKNEKKVVITFLINDDEFFTWEFLPHHFVIKPLKEVAIRNAEIEIRKLEGQIEALNEKSRNLYDEVLDLDDLEVPLKKIKNQIADLQRREDQLTRQSAQEVLSLFNNVTNSLIYNIAIWYLSTNNIELIMEEKSAYKEQVFYGFPVKNPELKTSVISNFIMNPQFDSLVLKLIKSLPAFDFVYVEDVMDQILDEKIERWYPWVKQEIRRVLKTKGKKELIFIAKKVIEDQIKDLYPAIEPFMKQVQDLPKNNELSQDELDNLYGIFIFVTQEKLERFYPYTKALLKTIDPATVNTAFLSNATFTILENIVTHKIQSLYPEFQEIFLKINDNDVLDKLINQIVIFHDGPIKELVPAVKNKIPQLNERSLAKYYLDELKKKGF